MKKEMGIFALGAIVAVVLIGGTNALNLRADGIQFPDGTVQVTAASGAPVQGFYLTEDTFPGAAATTACVSGYHMASAWELRRLVFLEYMSGIPGALGNLSGWDMNEYTPPTGTPGWFRTGGLAVPSGGGRYG